MSNTGVPSQHHKLQLLFCPSAQALVLDSLHQRAAALMEVSDRSDPASGSQQVWLCTRLICLRSAQFYFHFLFLCFSLHFKNTLCVGRSECCYPHRSFLPPRFVPGGSSLSLGMKLTARVPSDLSHPSSLLACVYARTRLFMCVCRQPAFGRIAEHFVFN